MECVKNNIFDGYGIVLDRNIVYEIINFLKEKEILKHECTVSYDGDINCNFSTNGFSPRFLLDMINIPKFYICRTNIDSEIVKDMVIYLHKVYKFDLVKYAEENDLKFIEAVILFCILHEIGHSMNSKRWVDKFGEFRLFLKEKDDRWDISFRLSETIRKSEDKIINIRKFHKTNIDYRKLSLERIADKTSMKLMKRFRIELCDMIRGRMDILTLDEYFQETKNFLKNIDL